MFNKEIKKNTKIKLIKFREKEKKSKFLFYLGDSLNEQSLLDIYLSEEAHRLNKTVGSLESSEYFCQVIYCLLLGKIMFLFDLESRMAI